jgi:hypothetical protein
MDVQIRDAIAARLAEAVAAMPPPERGPQGIQGERGVAGLSITGDRGPAGADGRNGKDADEAAIEERVSARLQNVLREAVARIPIPKDGQDGAPGAVGPTGARGETGAMGVLPIAHAWKPNMVCYAGDAVTHCGALWQAVEDTGRAPADGVEAWICLATAGRDAPALNFRGAYKPDGIYANFDVVMCGGSSFVSQRDEPGDCPGDGWALLAGTGRRGTRGVPGAKGERGDVGPAGRDAPPALPGPLIVGWKFVSDYAVVPVLDDDRVGAALDLRPLFERFNSERSG